MAGHDNHATPSTTPAPVPPITPAPGEDGSSDENTRRAGPLDSARIRDWYQNSGPHTETDMKNPEGLVLKGHHWEVPNPRGKVVLVHGYGVHSRFEYLKHDHENPSAPPCYEGSWIHQLNQVHLSVHCLDHQSFGGSQGHKGKRAHVLELEHLPRDLIQFLHEQVLPSQDSNLPIFVCGISMGGCVTARVIEILGGGPTTAKKAVRPEEANNNDEVDPSGTSTAKLKQALPIRGAACLAPMFRLDRLKKKHKIFLPSIKALSSLFPALEIGKPAKNQLYPFFEEMLHADPLCYTGKSRARMSHEMLRAVATVQEQAKYLSFPDASVKTSESPLPLPVYVPETPALLIVHSQNDTFVDPEGSIIVGATVHAKLQGNSEIVEKYQSLYDEVAGSETSVQHPDANLWLLEKMWHCLSKEHPDSDILIERLIKEWILPHLGEDTEKKADKKEDKKKEGGKDEKKEETAPAGAAAPSLPTTEEKEEKHKKKDKKKDHATEEASSSSSPPPPPPPPPPAPVPTEEPPSSDSAQPATAPAEDTPEKKEETAPFVSSAQADETAEGGQPAASSATPPRPSSAQPAEDNAVSTANEGPAVEASGKEEEPPKEEERRSPDPPPSAPQDANNDSQEGDAGKSEEVSREEPKPEEGKDEAAKESTTPPPVAEQEEPAGSTEETGEGKSSAEGDGEGEKGGEQEQSPANEEKVPSPTPAPEGSGDGPKADETPSAAPEAGGNADDSDL